MRQAFLFNEISINSDLHTHVFFSDLERYVNWLKANSASFVALSEDNYRIVQGVFKTKETDTTQGVTYIVDCNVDEQGRVIYDKSYKCYFVKDIKSQSGMAFLELEVDEWGSNIERATLTDFIAKRCNRKISGGGVYDTPKALGRPNIDYPLGTFNNDLETNTDWDIVIAVDYVVSKTTAETSKVISKMLLRVHPKDVMKARYGDDWKNVYGKQETPLMMACRYISTIYKSDIGTNLVNLEASVSGIYLVPYQEYLDTYYKFVFKDPYGEVASTTDFTLNAFVMGEVLQTIELDIPAKLTTEQLVNNQVFVGTPLHKTPLPRFTEQEKYKVIFRYNPDGISVTGYFGTEQVDLTDDFTFPNLSKASDTDAYTITNSILNAGFNLLKSGLKVKYAEDDGKRSNALAGLAQASLSPMVSGNAKTETIASRGNAINAFYLGQARTGGYIITYTQYPFTYSLNPSFEDEMKRAYVDGATFDTDISKNGGLKWVEQQEHLGTAYNGAPSETFIAGEVEVSGVPTIAETYIKQEIARGIYFVLV